MSQTIQSDSYITVPNIAPEIIEVDTQKPEIIVCTISPTRVRK